MSSSTASTVHDPELAPFEQLQVSTLSDAMFALGLKDTALGPSVRLLVGKRILGRARTIGRVPLPSNGGQQEIRPEFSLAIQEVIYGCGPNSIMGIATQGIATHANWGGNMAGRFRLPTATRNERVICAGVLIRPGDIIVGDADGVVVIDPAQAGAIVAKAKELVKVEEEMQAFMRTGAKLEEAVRKYKVR